MKERLAHFLVAHSRVILIIFILLALGCAALIPWVNINKDMTKYLPEDSAMRHGLDLMEAEFGKEESSSLEVMFDDLASPQEKGQVLVELEALPNVESVDYEQESEDEDQIYNRGKYTRYIINCESKQYSKEAAQLWQAVQDTFGEEHRIELGGSINDANENGLPLWITASAVSLIVLILLIMASSWIEPVAFLITIGVAVLINMGTYCLFPSISDTTFGIVAVLQLALSMDYSIMLLNRYRQERKETGDKNEAMRRALSLSFGAITGSSLTTFAGLLALVFMSFAMGADIGLALAKGVLISLLCIFTVLPALLLGFDNLMLRTVKRTLPFDLPRLSAAQFKLRIPLTLLFAALFISAFIARSGVDFSYSQGMDSKIDEVFGHTNTIVMMYDGKDGETAGDLAAALEDREDVRSAVCYESTLGKQRNTKDMHDFIEDMAEEEEDAADMDLSESVIRLIYYDYHASDPSFCLTVPQFVSYLQDDVLDDPDFKGTMSQDTRDDIDDMDRFTDRQALTTAKGAAALADFFDMKESQAAQLLLYYQIKHHRAGQRMSLPGFISFLIHDVASDPDYGSMISSSSLRKLKSMRVYTNKKKMKKKRTYLQAAKLFGMDEAQMRLVYVTHHAKTGSASEYTIADLALILGAMAEDPMLQEQFGTEEMAQLIAGLTQIGQMDPTPYDMEKMMEALAGYGMPLEPQLLTMVYAYGDVSSDPASYRLSAQKVVHFMLKEKSISGGMTKKQRKQLKTLRKIIDVSISGKRLSAASMGKILRMKASAVNDVYLLHQYKRGRTGGWKLTPQQFIDFLVNQVLTDSDMRSKVGENSEDLKQAQKLINSVVEGREFTYEALADLLDGFKGSGSDGDDAGSGGTDFSKDDICLLYELYGADHYFNKKWTMDLTQMVTHLDEDMISRPAFAKSMEEDEIDDVHEMREDMDEAAELLEGGHYGRMMITAELEEDSDETREFMHELTEAADSHFSEDTYLIGNTPMAWEMSRSFHRELNKITLITALFIFTIVLLTFRRLAAPVILVLIIQCAVFMTMGVLNFLHVDMNYLALLIVQSIMMGATIDYAIVYTSYYVEKRDSMGVQEAIRASYKGSLQTILTSAIILIAAVGVLSFAFSQPATRQICRILSVGCLMATILVIFILPGLLACMDRFIARRKKTQDAG